MLSETEQKIKSIHPDFEIRYNIPVEFDTEYLGLEYIQLETFFPKEDTFSRLKELGLEYIELEDEEGVKLSYTDNNIEILTNLFSDFFEITEFSNSFIKGKMSIDKIYGYDKSKEHKNEYEEAYLEIYKELGYRPENLTYKSLILTFLGITKHKLNKIELDKNGIEYSCPYLHEDNTISIRFTDDNVKKIKKILENIFKKEAINVKIQKIETKIQEDGNFYLGRIRLLLNKEK